VTVATEDDAAIAIDGRAVATAPARALELPAGKHLLAITHRGREPYGRELVVARGQAVTVSAPLVKTGRRRAVPWLFGGSALLAAGATTTAIVAPSHRAASPAPRSSAGGRLRRTELVIAIRRPR
jgi:hypothetical protein